MLEVDVKLWLKNPITKMYFSILESIAADSKVNIVNCLDECMSVSSEEFKNIYNRNFAQRELIATITNTDSVIRDFKDAKLILVEGEDDETTH